MSNQPPYGQPPAGPPPGPGPGGPPGPPQGPPPGPPGPPPPGGYPPGGPPPPGGPGGPPPPGGPGGPFPPGGPGGPPFGPGEPPGKSKKPLIIGITAAVVVLAGIGALLFFTVFSGDDDYCTVLEENSEALGGVTSDEAVDPDAIEQYVNAFHELRDLAPEEVADEWDQIDEPFAKFEEALDEAGLAWSDVSSGQLPSEVQEAGGEFLQEIGELDLSALSQTISDHAQDECGLDLDEGESSS